MAMGGHLEVDSLVCWSVNKGSVNQGSVNQGKHN